MFKTPEDRAREKINHLLEQAGWVIQDRDSVDLRAGVGIAVQEFKVKTGDADYVLFVNRQAVGVIEAKRVGVTLSGVEVQSAKYSSGYPEELPAPRRPLPFLYESTGQETFFTNLLDPVPRARRVFAFHRPETLAEWISEGEETLRKRLREYPPLIEDGLWRAQIAAIHNLEASMADDWPRALIQMATGAGKTYTAVNFIYRMLQFGRARRVLFLVDRTNLARQALREFQNFTTPDDGRKFTDIYNVQRLASNTLDSVSKVTITTIQRMYSMLRGEDDLDTAEEELSMWDNPAATSGSERIVTYNPRIPIEYYDVIIVDECHRSIYNLWRQVLEYFDAYIIGLTATPSMQTFGYFHQNLVMEYTRKDAIIDGVNVDSRLYRIRTRITQDGSRIQADGETYIPKRDRRTRAQRMELLDQDFDYDNAQLDSTVVTPDQIRTIIRTFRDRLFSEIFPGRSIVPKTVIFAKDDSHAEDIVRIVREEFAEGNDFCKKITYRVSGVDPNNLIVDFRNSFNPRIVVTVDMIATGTDIKPIEILLFMRAVKSAGLFEQMQGRGTRVIHPDDLRLVTSDAHSKDFFVIVDAVGVMDTEKAETPTLESLPSTPFPRLLDLIAQGSLDDAVFTTLAGRLGRLGRKLRPADRDAIEQASGGLALSDIAKQLLDAADIDRQIEAAAQMYDTEYPTAEQIEEAARELKYNAADLLEPELRKLLIEIHSREEQVIDEISKDSVLEAGYMAMDTDAAEEAVQTFREFIEQHRDEITALQILYDMSYSTQRLQWAHIKELAQRLEAPPYRLDPEKLWAAYAKVEGDRVRMGETKRLLTDLIALVRHALQPESDLIPYPEQVRARYAVWLDEQRATGRRFTQEQRAWLDVIAEHIGVNLAVDVRDFNEVFYDLGGVQAALGAFGDGKTLQELVTELNVNLVA